MSCYFYFVLDPSCEECNVISLYFSVNGSACLVCCGFDSACELFG